MIYDGPRTFGTVTIDAITGDLVAYTSGSDKVASAQARARKPFRDFDLVVVTDDTYLDLVSDHGMCPCCFAEVEGWFDSVKPSTWTIEHAEACAWITWYAEEVS